MPSRETFLLKEYEEVWAYSREINGMRVKAAGFYIVVLGGVAGVAIGHKLLPLELPSYFVYPTVLLLMLASWTLQIHLARWRSQASEYATVLNGVRAAFGAEDPWLNRYLVLPQR